MSNTRIGRNSAPFMPKNKTGLFQYPGPYIGVVKNATDVTRAGRLQVYIPYFGGPNENDPNNWITVRYASPFRGHTRGKLNPTNYIDPSIDPNGAENSFQSYGFWFVPPDLNCRVLCLFANGDLAQGYWIACIEDALSSHMVPGIGAIEASKNKEGNDGGYIWNPNQYVSHKMLQKYVELKQGTNTEIPWRLPVAEPALSDQTTIHPGGVQMMPLVYQTLQLGIQGLAFDFIRGTTTSAGYRESPSNTYGISTPGRLTSFANVAVSEPLVQEIASYLNSGPNPGPPPPDIQKALSTGYRTGGHQFVMDDGNVSGYGQGIRLRTTAGNQILMDDTNGQIYVINSAGTAWIELSPSGFIDIYSAKGYNVRTEGSINFHADEDISMFAGNSFNVHTNGDMQIEATGDLVARSTGTATVYASDALNLGSAGAALVSGSTAKCLSTAGSTTSMNGIPPMPVSDPGALPFTQQVAVTKQSGSEVWWQNGQFNTICDRAPAHEPWPGHEVNGIQTYNIEQGTIGGSIVRPQTGTTGSGVRGSRKGATINEADIANAPKPGHGVGCLTPEQTQALFAQMAKHESGGSYSKVQDAPYGYHVRKDSKGTYLNQGFVGKYQMGAQALETCGYLKPGSFEREGNQAIYNDANWQNGITSLQAWLSNGPAQEQEMLIYTQLNYNGLKRSGVLGTCDLTPEKGCGGADCAAKVGGALMAAHLGGVGNAEKYMKTGTSFADAFNTPISSYFNLGSNAVRLGTSTAGAGAGGTQIASAQLGPRVVGG